MKGHSDVVVTNERVAEVMSVALVNTLQEKAVVVVKQNPHLIS